MALSCVDHSEDQGPTFHVSASLFSVDSASICCVRVRPASSMRPVSLVVWAVDVSERRSSFSFDKSVVENRSDHKISDKERQVRFYYWCG